MARQKVEIGERLEWPDCELCGGRVSAEDGFLSITWKDIRELVQQQRVERAKEPEVVSLADLLADGVRQYWRWGHATCLPSNDDYWIPAQRIDTLEKAMAWTLHLLEKNWFPATDWEHAIRRLYNVGSC